jgi:hypothetical protein
MLIQFITLCLVSKCPGLKINFTLSDVSETAKELAKNWLYKIASIRGEQKLFILVKNNFKKLFCAPKEFYE